MAPRPRTQAEMARDRQAEDEKRQMEIYGDLLPDVSVLRRRGFVVNREGNKFRVGNKLLNRDEVRAMAQREGGLAGMSFTRRTETASGLQVGQSVPLRPRRPSTATPLPSTKQKALAGAAAAKKAQAAQHSTELGAKPRVVWLDLGLLTVDKTYQRDISQQGAAHVNRILQAFNWNCYQPIIVSERPDGTYAVIDGQHRLEAAKKHPLVDSLPCYIIDAPDVAKQASIFVAVNSRRISLTSLQQFHAAIAARQPEALEAAAVCRNAGVTILRSPPSYDIPAKSIVAPFTLLKLLRQVGRPAVSAAIRLLADAQPEAVNAFRSPTIAALTRLCADPKVERGLLKALIADADMARLYDDIRNERIARGGTLETAAERVLRARLRQPSARAA